MKIKRIGRKDINGDFLPHSHNSHEILYITRGEGKVKVGGSTTDLSAGDIVFIPAGMEHTGPGGKDCGVIYVIADHPTPQRLLKPFVIRDDERHSIHTYFENIYDIFMRPDNDVSYKKVEDTLCELIFELVFSLKSESEADGEVAKLCNTIIKGFRAPDFDLGGEMAAISRSVTYLRRRFSAEMGMNPCRYLKSVRIGYAKKLIGQKKHNEFTFTQIAHECGYEDERYFTRVFKKECGVTPGEYYHQIF